MKRKTKSSTATTLLASACHHGDLIRHAGLDLSLAILTDTCWIARLATESCGTAPTRYVPLSAEVELVRAFATASPMDAGTEVDPLLRGAP